MGRMNKPVSGMVVAGSLLGMLLSVPYAHAATLTWNGGLSGDWVNGGSGWLNGLSPATWNNATPDNATFAGSLTLSPTINAGGITVGDLVFSSGSYAFSGGTLTLASGNIAVGSGLTATFSQALAGTAGLTKTGDGTLSLSGNNKNYSGTTTINAGAIEITDTAAGSIGSSASGTIALNGGAIFANFSLNRTPGHAFTIGASGGEFRTLGTGRWLMTANRISGSGTLTLRLASASRFQPANSQSGFSGKWIFDGDGDQNRIIDFNGGSGSGYLGTGTGDDVLTIIDSPALLLRNGVILGTPLQGIALGAGEAKLTVAGGSTATIGGKLNGPSGNNVQFYTDNTTSILIVSNTANSWLGNTSIQGFGIVRLGNAGVFPDNGGVVDVFSSTAVLDLNGFNETIGGLTGLGRVDNRAASTTVSLGVGGNNLDSTFSGILTNSGSSALLRLVKVGTGTLTLSGNGINHQGGLVISNGAVQFSAVGAGRLGASATAEVTLQGGTLQGNFAANTTVGNTITVGANGGTLRNIGSDSQRWQMSANQVFGSGTLTLAFSNQNTRFTFANAQDNFTGKWIVDSGGNVNRFVDLNYVSGNGFGAATGDDAITFENNGAVLIRNNLALGTPSQGITLGSGRARLSVASTSTGTIDGKISGPPANQVQFYLDNANSVLILSNTANSWAGASQVNAGGSFGTLRLGASGVIPDTGGVFEVSTTAQLDLNGFNETIGGLSGAGRVENLAGGTTATLAMGGNNGNATFSGLITNSGALSSTAITKLGTGTQTFSTANGYAGLTTVDAGALRITHAGALGSTAAGTVVNSGGTIELQGGIYVSGEALTLSGTGVGAAGALRNISGNNTWQGSIQLNNTAALTISSDSGDLKLRGLIIQTGSTPPVFQGNGNIFIETSMNGGLVRGSGNGDVLISSGTTITGDVTVAASATGAFKVEGTLVGDVTMNGGQLTGVAGTMDDVTVNNGTLSPGANGVALLNLNSLTLNGGVYLWNITNATGTAGTQWDLLRVGSGSGAVNLSGAPVGSITVRVAFAATTLTNFNHQTSGSWMIVDAGSVSGFNANKFVIDDSAFGPGSDGGTWSVSQSGGDLYLDYAPGAAVDLAVSVTDAPDPVPVGDTVTYTIVITNRSATTVQEFAVTNMLGINMAYVSSSDGGVHAAGVTRWTLTNLAANGSRTITLSANASVQGAVSLVTVVQPRRAESAPADNVVTSTTSVFCPTAGLATNNAPAFRVTTNGVSISFTVTAANDDCNPPFLRAAGLPGGASFNVVTTGYSVAGTFLWPSPTSGTHPVRFFSFNETKATSTVITLIHVNNGAEGSNAQGIPNSQTNWSVEIAGLSAVSGGQTELSWHADPGITYDIYRATGNLGDGAILWTKVLPGVEAGVAVENVLVNVPANQQYYQVVPEGKAVSSNSVWAIIRPALPPGFSTISAPVDGSDLSFSGDFGAALAAVLTGHNVPGNGAEAFILQSGGTYTHLFLDASDAWREAGPGTPLATQTLNPGQGVVIANRQLATAYPEFRGPVGNTASATITIPAGGYTILGVSEGRHLTLAQAFSDITAGGGPVGSFDENAADMILVLNSNGSYTPLQRLPNGTWLDLTTFSTSSLRFTPGAAYWYYRAPSAPAMTVRF
ncbi:MAG TPA: autotransporter-associated beta strand repeat-containing protein [Kiritimatiellia bacterium]|nr:autotransporter-associated beta strand repeat-containing protein [Kiritimatiellia bacterium]